MSRLKQNSRYSKAGTQASSPTYTQKNQETWGYLFKKQQENLQNKANPLFLKCLKSLQLPETHIPKISEVSMRLKEKTGWEVIEVAGLINSETFFGLLANKRFPSTAYIRNEEELTISRDPDIFHELFGHVPMLTHPTHSCYVQRFGQLGLSFNQIERALLQRLYWFTYETGLISTPEGTRIMGGSLMSSIQESIHVFHKKTNKKPFSLLETLRTPYRADKIQHIYFVLDCFETLFNILDDSESLRQNLWKAYHLGEYPAPFPVEDTKYENVGCCEYILEDVSI